MNKLHLYFFKKIGLFTFLSVILYFNLAYAQDNLPHSAAYPGGLVIISLNQNSATTPKVFYHEHRAMVIKNQDGQWITVIGIPLETKIGEQAILIKMPNGQNYQQEFTVLDKQYEIRHITIADKSKVTPGPKLQRKIDQEEKQINKILATWTNTPDVSLVFQRPIVGAVSSTFGLNRIYNNVKNGRHTGVDLVAPLGTPIHAAASGKIIGIGNYVLTGNTVFIDHGQGLISVYCHMNSVKVKRGQKVTKDEVIGTIGRTGRVTGPHLHWGVSLNGAKINPDLLVQKE